MLGSEEPVVTINQTGPTLTEVTAMTAGHTFANLPPLNALETLTDLSFRAEAQGLAGNNRLHQICSLTRSPGEP